jgi:DUF4097 and DUF4098 domain-containing protein YvlB
MLAPLALAQQGRIYQDGGSWAQEITGSLAAARMLRIRVDAGAVQVQGGSQAGISYVFHTRAFSSSEDQARRQFNNYKISSYVHGDTAWIVGDWEGGRTQRFSGTFVVNVPQNIELVKVETEGGDVSASGISGRVQAETGGGKIHIDNIGGAVSAETGGDSIDIGPVGGDVNIETGGGKVSIGPVKGKLNASTGGGDIVMVSSQEGAVLEAGGGNIQVQQCGGQLKVSTGGGNIDVGDVGGPVTIETGGGSIRVGSAKGMVQAETGAGRVDLGKVPAAHVETGAGAIVATFVPGGESTDSLLQTSAGDVTVYLAPNLHVTVQAAVELANGHSIHSDFSEIHVNSEGGDWGPKTITAEGSLNGGGPVLKIRTTTGDVNIRRAGQ